MLLTVHIFLIFTVDLANLEYTLPDNSSIILKENDVNNILNRLENDDRIMSSKIKTFNQDDHQKPLQQSKKSVPLKLSMKQGLLMNQVLGFYGIDNPEDELCRIHTEEFKKGLRAFEPWALKMFDSSSKLQSGILLGNLFEFGSYLQCLEILSDSENGPIFGKHCTLKITPSLALIEKIVHYRNVSKKRFEIIKIIVEKAELSWSTCVPHSCPATDVLNHYKKRIMEMAEGLEISVSLDENHCNTIFNRPVMGKIQYFVLTFLGAFIFMAIISAGIDYMSNQGDINMVFKIFSMYTNFQKIIARGVQTGFNFIHGLRFFSTCYVVLGHRYIMFMVDPTVNGLGILEWVLQYPSSLILGSTVSVDSFFMISGMLVSIGFFDHVTKTGKFNIFLFYIHRYLRITSPLAVSVLIWCTLVQFLGHGTLMYDVYVNHQKHCQDYWWSTLLHIQTYINPGKWCNYPIWYLSCEMPFYYFSPILLYPLWKWPIFGLVNCAVMYVLSLILSFYLAWKNQYTGDMLPITNQLLVTDYFKYYYTQPHVRISPYIIGIVFGYFIFKTKGKTVKIPRSINIILWITSLITMITTIFGSRVFQLENHTYNVWESSSYLSFSRSAWTVCLVWVIWACLNGYGGIINDILSAHIFGVLSRISYSVFLLHTTLQLYMDGNMKVPIYFSNFNAIYYAIADVTIVTITGLFFTLCFEMPLVRAESLLFNPRKVIKKVDANIKKEKYMP